MPERLRVALIAPIAQAVGPRATSSIEALVWLLARELDRRGHAVTVFATGDSQVAGRLVATYAHGYHDDAGLWDRWELHEVLHAAAAFERGDRFDVIHSHSYHYALPLTRMAPGATVVHTYHVNPCPDVLAAYARYPEVRLVAVSDYHRTKFRDVGEVAVVRNGIDVAAFPYRRERGDYLLFLGHLIAKKGPREAVAVARRAGRRLLLAGKAGEYYREQVAPLVDGRQVCYVGPVSVEERDALLAGAAALLFTSVAAEPFGLVLLEAMACGTPVAALDRCAVREIVTPGVTGYLAADVAGLAARIPDVTALDRGAVRAEVARRFGVAAMTAGYERVYRGPR